MKRIFALCVLALLLIPAAAPAELETRAATIVMAELKDAPREEAQVLMEYYPGTRVEVVREADGQYVQVNVGEMGGSLMGYMKKEDLTFGEANIRAFRELEVTYPWRGWTMYSACDKLSQVIAAYNDTFIYAMGEYGDWIHIVQEAGDQTITGFVHKPDMPEEVAAQREIGYAWGIVTSLLPDEVQLETAIAYAREQLIGQPANGQKGVAITEEMLDGCSVHTRVYYEYGLEELTCAVTFIYQDRTWEDGLPMLCGFVQMWIEGDQIVRYNYGNG